MKRMFKVVALLAALVVGPVGAVAVAKTGTSDPTVGPKGLKFYSPSEAAEWPAWHIDLGASDDRRRVA